MLLPRESETREIKDLSGIWRFKADRNDEGLRDAWHDRPLDGAQDMPVPASFNDITQDAGLRDHIGLVWYETSFFVPARWRDRRLFIRFGSVAHTARVWVNGRHVVAHEGGFLPFEAEASALIACGAQNRLTVAVDNRLSWSRLPTGEVKTITDPGYPPDYRMQEYHFDFFNYAGIHRPVKLCARNPVHVVDIDAGFSGNQQTGELRYSIAVAGNAAGVRATLFTPEGRQCAAAEGADGVLSIDTPRLWGPGNGVRYTLQAEVMDDGGTVVDVYRQPIGLRTIRVEGDRFLINDQPVYFRGFGKHEDMLVKGRGYDDVMAIKDANLLSWVGANSYRTSHYPYADELLEIADRRGLLIIDELPAVGMHFFDENRQVFCQEHVSDATLGHHLQTLEELVARDKLHPSVVMWSLANEAATYEQHAVPYFETLVRRARELDDRPLTLAHCPVVDRCNVAHLFDVLCLNRYYGWYFEPGRLELIEQRLERNLREWHERFKKPIIISEYGADTVAGMHSDPPVMFSEEFQTALLDAYHRVFDRLPFVIGEHVWNFADFGTKQGTVRVMGNRKGVFTRDRQPKAAAHLLRRRWTARDSQTN